MKDGELYGNPSRLKKKSIWQIQQVFNDKNIQVSEKKVFLSLIKGKSENPSSSHGENVPVKLGAGAGAMLRGWEHLLLFQTVDPSPQNPCQAAHNSRGSDALFWPPQAPCTHACVMWAQTHKIGNKIKMSAFVTPWVCAFAHACKCSWS